MWRKAFHHGQTDCNNGVPALPGSSTVYVSTAKIVLGEEEIRDIIEDSDINNVSINNLQEDTLPVKNITDEIKEKKEIKRTEGSHRQRKSKKKRRSRNLKEVTDSFGSIQDSKDAVKKAACSDVQKAKTVEKMEEEERSELTLSEDNLKLDLRKPTLQGEIVPTIWTILDTTVEIGTDEVSVSMKEKADKESKDITEEIFLENHFSDNERMNEISSDLEKVSKIKDIKEKLKNKTEVNLPFCSKEIFGISQEIKEGLIEAPTSVVQKVVDKINHESEKNMEKEERRASIENEIAATETLFTEECVVESIQDIKKGLIQSTTSVAKNVGDKIDNKIDKEERRITEDAINRKEITATEFLFTKESVTNVESIQNIKEGLIQAATSVLQKVVDKIDTKTIESIKDIKDGFIETVVPNLVDKVEDEIEREEKRDKCEVSNEMKLANSEHMEKEERRGTDYVCNGNKIARTEPLFTEGCAKKVQSIQDLKEGLTQAATSVVQKVVDKIDNKLEKNFDKEERNDMVGVIYVKEIPANEPVFKEEYVESIESIKDIKDGFIAAVVPNIVDKIDDEIEREEKRHTFEVNNVIKLANNEYMEKEEKRGTEDICNGNEITATEPILTEGTVKTVESIEDIEEDLIQTASSVVQKVVDKNDNEIEKNIEKEERKDMIGVINVKEIPAVEPVFKEKYVELIESIKEDIKDGFIEAVVPKIADKIDDEIEREEKRHIFEVSNELKLVDNEHMEKEERRGAEDVCNGKEISATEHIFTEGCAKTVDSIQDIKEDLIQAAISVVQKVVDKIDDKVETNVEKEERTDMVDVINDVEIPATEQAFKKEYVGTIETIKDIKACFIEAATSEVPNIVDKLDNEIEGEEKRDPVEVSNEMQIADNELVISKETVGTWAIADAFPDTTSILESITGDEKQECGKDLDDEHPADVSEAAVGGEFGAIAFAVFTVFIAMLFYYL